MRWTYQITAASRPDVLRRLVQIVEQHSLTVRSVELALLNNRVKISLTVEVEPLVARKLQARLSNQSDVQDVDLLAS